MKQTRLTRISTVAIAALFGVAYTAGASVLYLMDDLGNNGTLHNGPTLSTDVPSISGADYAGNHSMHFAGANPESVTDPHIRIVDTSAGDAANTLDLSLTDFTIQAWIKPTGERNMTLFQDAGVRNFNGHSIGMRYVHDTSDSDGTAYAESLRFTIQTGNNQPINLFTGSGSVPRDAWTHVAASVDRASGSAQIYLNGSAVSAHNDNSGNTLGATDPAHDNNPGENMVQSVGAEFWGAGINTTQGWIGNVDEFRISLSTLSAAQIAQSANQSLVPEPGTFALLALGGGLLAFRRRIR